MCASLNVITSNITSNELRDICASIKFAFFNITRPIDKFHRSKYLYFIHCTQISIYYRKMYNSIVKNSFVEGDRIRV